jgi:hypothetical protein
VWRISEDLSDVLSALHRRGWWLVAGLASVHILAVVAFFLVREDNLIYAMFSGTKALPGGTADPAGAKASTVRALALLACCAFAVGWLVTGR